MFKKIERKLEERMERWSKKKLIICQTCMRILLVLCTISLCFLATNGQNTPTAVLLVNIPVFAIVLWVIIAALVITISWKIIRIIDLIQVTVKLQEKEDDKFNSLQKVLSRKEYRKVIYSPYLRRYKCNSNISYEDEELEYCKGLLVLDGVTHYAIIADSSVMIITKNKDGELIGNRHIDATTFCRNYEVLEE